MKPKRPFLMSTPEIVKKFCPRSCIVYACCSHLCGEAYKNYEDWYAKGMTSYNEQMKALRIIENKKRKKPKFKPGNRKKEWE